MSLRLITAPPVEPISLEEAKAHLHVDSSDEDALISMYIKAARRYCEGPNGLLGRALVTQTWELVLDDFPTDGDIQIPLPPLQEVTSVFYDGADGFEQTLDPSAYVVDTVSEPGWIVGAASSDWPTVNEAINSVRIRFVAGYAPTTDSPPSYTDNVPDDLKAGMLLLIGSMYENRSEVEVGTIASKLPFASMNLLMPYRVTLGMA